MAFPAVFFVVDPFGVIPMYLAMTRDDPPGKKRSIALRASIASTLFLILFALAGGLIFRLFGITLAAFKIAGGILLLLMSIDMIRAQPTRARTSPEEEREGIEKDDVALIPLAIPMLAGPGSVSTVMVLMGQAGGAVLKLGAVIASVVLTGAVSYVVLRGAEMALKLLRQTGINVIARVMGLILSAIAIQFILNGLFDAYQQFFQAGAHVTQT
ncbi:MAG: MarC family protein [Deltaproteobacteria bacterium]|nr:MarC family protein [Deltaproteobacteria bacterium]